MIDSSLDRLVAMLKERGEHVIQDEHSATWGYYTDPHTAIESMDGTLIVTGLTPEQAVIATFGGGRMTEYVYGTDEQGEHWLTGEVIVRCRDCMHYHEGMCMLSDGMGDFKRWYVDADGFCSDGEKVVSA